MTLNIIYKCQIKQGIWAYGPVVFYQELVVGKTQRVKPVELQMEGYGVVAGLATRKLKVDFINVLD